jgi:hypothetical protein
MILVLMTSAGVLIVAATIAEQKLIEKNHLKKAKLKNTSHFIP